MIEEPPPSKYAGRTTEQLLQLLASPKSHTTDVAAEAWQEVATKTSFCADSLQNELKTLDGWSGAARDEFAKRVDAVVKFSRALSETAAIQIPSYYANGDIPGPLPAQYQTFLEVSTDLHDDITFVQGAVAGSPYKNTGSYTKDEGIAYWQQHDPASYQQMEDATFYDFAQNWIVEPFGGHVQTYDEATTDYTNKLNSAQHDYYLAYVDYLAGAYQTRKDQIPVNPDPTYLATGHTDPKSPYPTSPTPLPLLHQPTAPVPPGPNTPHPNLPMSPAVPTSPSLGPGGPGSTPLTYPPGTHPPGFGGPGTGGIPHTPLVPDPQGGRPLPWHPGGTASFPGPNLPGSDPSTKLADFSGLPAGGGGFAGLGPGRTGLPDGLPGNLPGGGLLGAGGLPGAGTGGAAGMPGGAGGLTGLGVGGRGAAGAAGPMMPMMPMGGAGAGAGREDGERRTWLEEDPEVWAPDVGGLPPAVLGT